jgi:hypothetical protein
MLVNCDHLLEEIELRRPLSASLAIQSLLLRLKGEGWSAQPMLHQKSVVHGRDDGE